MISFIHPPGKLCIELNGPVIYFATITEVYLAEVMHQVAATNDQLQAEGLIERLRGEVYRLPRRG